MTADLQGALEGTSVVALATNIPGPLAASRLHELGARIVKIEPPQGDALAHAAPLWYEQIRAGMDVVELDLRAPADVAELHERVQASDVLITAMRARSLQRIGLGWEQLHARSPRVVHLAVVGEASPNDDRAGHDLTYQARAGLLTPPAMPATVLADLGAAERAVWSVLAALRLREREGVGRRVEVAIVDAATEFAAPLRFGLTGSGGVLSGAFAPYAMYRAKDGWVAVAALEPHFARRLAEALALEALDAASLERSFLDRTVAQWESFAGEHDLPLAAIIAH
jgi:crotonobetainyl-CoA:carnitine CoA-transferase CaiB-like acyl-CoA transferase